MALVVTPISLRDANAYVRDVHRHSDPVRGHKFSVAVADGAGLRGVAISGRPIARMLDNGWTIEILRVCTDGARNACSALYGASCRAAQAMGYRLAVTYTRADEPGVSLKAAGFKPIARVDDEQWTRRDRISRSRRAQGDKIRWERSL